MADPTNPKQIGDDASAASKIIDGLKAKLAALSGVRVGQIGEDLRGMAKAGEGVAARVPGALNAAKAAIEGVGATVSKVLNGDIRGALAGIGKAAEAGIGKLTEKLSQLGPYGQAAAAAITVLTSVVGALAGSMLDAMGAAIGMVEGGARIKATFDALAGGKAAGAATLKMISDLSAKLPFTTGQIREWAQSLMAAGLQGEALKSALEAVAAAQALMGDSGAAAAQNMMKQLAEGGKAAETLLKGIQEGSKKSAAALAEMGLSSKDLADALGMTPEKFAKAKISAEQMNKAIQDALKKKGQGPLDEMMGSWPVIMAKVKAGLMSLLGDLGPAVKPFMAEVKKLFEAFYKGGSVITFLKPIFTAVFSTLFSWATRAVSAVRAVMDALLNSTKAGGMLSGAIAVLKGAWAGIVAIFGAVKAGAMPIIEVFKKIFSNAAVLDGLKAIFTTLAVVIGAVAIAIAVVAAVVATVAGGIAAAVGGIVAAFALAAEGISTFVSSAVGVLEGLVSAAGEVGSNMVAGLVDAITGGIGAAVGAVVNMVKGVIDAARGAADAHSPSRKMIGLVGKPLGQGVHVGMTAENDNARAAAGKTVRSAIEGAGKAKDNLGKLGAPAPKGEAAAAPSSTTYQITIQQPPGATRKEGEEFAAGFMHKMRELQAEAA